MPAKCYGVVVVVRDHRVVMENHPDGGPMKRPIRTRRLTAAEEFNLRRALEDLSWTIFGGIDE